MAFPTTDKTWQFNVNQKIPSTGVLLTDRQNMLFAIKAALVGFGSTPWTVTGSSNSTAAGMDAVDRWVTAANLVWAAAGSAHSWIVLKQTGLNATFELLLDCSNANSGNATITWAISGFTGGSTTAAPTATASVTSISNTFWYSDTSIGPNALLHVMQSSDGQCTRIFSNSQQGTTWYPYPYFTWLFETIQNPSTGWATPFIVFCNAGSYVNSKTRLDYLANNARFAGKHGAVAMALFATSEGMVTDYYYGLNVAVQNAALKRPTQISGKWPLFPVGVASDTTGAKGFHGNLYDMFACPRFIYGMAAGSIDNTVTYPDDSTRTWVGMDQLLVPWDGTTPQALL